MCVFDKRFSPLESMKLNNIQLTSKNFMSCWTWDKREAKTFLLRNKVNETFMHKNYFTISHVISRYFTIFYVSFSVEIALKECRSTKKIICWNINDANSVDDQYRVTRLQYGCQAHSITPVWKIRWLKYFNRKPI